MSQPRVVAALAHHKRITTVVILLAIAGIIIPQLHDFGDSLHILSQASWPFVLVAIFLTILNYLLLAEIYHLLVKKPVSLRSLQLVQLATGLTSRLAPIGVGTVALNILFLRRRNHTLPQAIAVVTVSGVILFAMHFVVLGIVALVVPLPNHVRLSIGWQTVQYGMIAIIAVLICLALYRPIRRRLVRAATRTAEVLASYRDQPRKLAAATILAAIQASVYVLALMACALALSTHIPFAQAYVIYTFSLLLGAAVATPGGLVGVEAGLAGGLVAYGVEADTALAIALLYRLVTYWLPLLPGLVALRLVQKRYF